MFHTTLNSNRPSAFRPTSPFSSQLFPSQSHVEYPPHYLSAAHDRNIDPLFLYLGVTLLLQCLC